MTTVQDLIYNASGALANGRVVIDSPSFTMNGVAIAASQTEADIVNGVLSVQLFANMTAQPTGVYYTARYELDQGPVFEEYWVIPNQPTVNLGQVRVTFPATPSVMINAQQLTSAGALPGQFLGWNGANWVPMYVSTFNYYPNFTGLNLSGNSDTDLSVSGSPATLGSSFTLNVPDAGPASRGVVNTGAQTFAGNKTFAGNVTVNGLLTGGNAVLNSLNVANLQVTGATNLLADPTTTLGDLIARGPSAPQRFGLGAMGQVLTVDTSQPLGLRWVTPTSAVTSVFGRTGAVIAQSGDYSWSMVTGAMFDPTTTKGDLPARGAASIGRFAVGSDGQVLVVDSSQTFGLRWAAASAVGPVSSVFGRTGAVAAQAGDYTVSQITGALADPTTTLGDLIVRGSAAPARLGAGANGQVLTVDSTQLLGVKWATPTSGGGGGTPAFACEVPTGAMNGVNAVFSLSYAPNPPQSLLLFLNGVEQDLGIYYSLSGSSVTYAIAPKSTDQQIAQYAH